MISPLGGKCIMYPDLADYNNINQVIKTPKVLLYLSRPDFGHFCALFRGVGGILYFFDPYGLNLDTQLNDIEPQMRQEQEIDGSGYLTRLLKASNYKFYDYSDFKHQKLGRAINSCGHWCVLRLYFDNLDDDEFDNLTKNLTDKEVADLILEVFK